MEKLIEKLDFGNVKLLRKNLMVSSATAIVISQLVKYSEGAIKFIAFTIPESNKFILVHIICALISYFFLALLVRMLDQEFPKFYKKKMKEIDIDFTYDPDRQYNEMFHANDPHTQAIEKLQATLKVRVWQFFRKYGILFLDIYLPFVLAIFALIWCYII